ncbi:LuxR family transcriptional regulator [Streptomyces sp. V1I1]|uniref:helix-turn-helix transcriptional regulator n=1 Tax=Streptomyces sp. V1I1 TaxID=3042272 RepID=UPI002780F24B|nr:LuxR family transcriptional regulator [Streptomyces sp. V1I1]MDQ0938841.1 DNA-binding CsgD family transcriptional regulator/tetratricopeptide (TPR) repeat protein [Streptomyces sp. V1I1]
MFAVPPQRPGVLPAAREVEIGQLMGIVEALGNGEGSVVEITGERGIGKTHLAGVLADLAVQRGLPVARAHAVRGSTTPYQVFRDAWRAQSCLRRSADGEEELLRTVHELAKGCVTGSVLLLDDLHLCDQASAELAVQLVRSPVPGPFLLALAHRPRQIGPALLQALDDGVRAGTVTRIAPDPLDAEAVAALFETRRTPGSPEPRGVTHAYEFAEQLCAAAEGNPLYVRILMAAGWHPDHWPDHAGTDTDGLLREATALITELDALNRETAITARAAAVLGCPFRPEDVAQVSGLGLERTLDALAELHREDLVRPANWGGRLAFRHRVISHVAHESADLSFRLRAHRRAIEGLVARGGRASERARHAEHLLGTDGAIASRTLAEAAAEIVARAPATAARWLGLALEPLPDGGQSSTPRATLELARCRALIASGRLEEARTLAHDMLGDHRSGLTEQQRLRAHAVCADAERRLGRYEEAEAMARAALGLLPRPLPDPLTAEAIELIFAFGLVHILRGNHGQARALLREASHARSGADDAARTAIGILAACCDAHIGNLDEAAPEVTRCARLVDAMPDSVAGHMPETLALLGCAEIYLERFPDAFRHLSRGVVAAGSGAQKDVLMHQLFGLSILDQWTGRLKDAQRRAREAETLARAIGAPDGVRLATALRASALIWARGRKYADEAIALTKRAVSATSLGQGWWATSAIGPLAQTQLLGGDAAGCLRTLLDGGGGDELPLVQPAFRPSLLALMATATLKCSNAEAARRLVRRAETEADDLGLPVQEACVRRARALIHVADGEHDAAAKLFELSAEGFRRAEMLVQHAWTLATGAPSADAAQGRAVATEWLDTAEAVARTFGTVLVGDQVARVRTQLSEIRRADRFLGLLSDREREIAELAASGLRSREIAERLFLSPRTVDSHLTRVYRKLHVSSRIALAHVLRRTE